MAVGDGWGHLPQLLLIIEFLGLFGTTFTNVSTREATRDGMVPGLEDAVRGHFAYM